LFALPANNDPLKKKSALLAQAKTAFTLQLAQPV
jgi:hypothetical protein